MPKSGDHAISDDGFEILWHADEWIETDRAGEIRRININKIVATLPWHLREYGLRQIAMRIEQSETLPGIEVLGDEVEQQRAFAGTGLTDEIKMALPLALTERDRAAQKMGAE